MSTATDLNYWNYIIDFINYYNRAANQEVNTKISYDIDNAGKQIARRNITWNGADKLGEKATVTYSFPSWQGIEKNCAEEEIKGPFSTLQQQQAELALQSWADVANLKFIKIDGDAYSNITFGNIDSKEDIGGYSLPPYTTLNHNKEASIIYDARGYDASGQSWYNLTKKDIATPELGNNGRFSLTHEIGHTLGLLHPGDYLNNEGEPSYQHAAYREDTQQFSIMSYWKESYTKADFKGYLPAAPLIDDIAAIQYLYGANMTTRTGDTIYGFNSNTERDFYTLIQRDQPAIFAIWDAGGNDTLDLSLYSQDQKINLNPGAFSDAGGLKGNISIAKGVVIENALGGLGNDMIIGNVADNLIKGGEGDDIIYGGLGQDQLWGGVGKDIFVFSDNKDSLQNSADKIMDFETTLDKIDLSFLRKNNITVHFVDKLSDQIGDALLTHNATTNISEFKLNTNGNTEAVFIIHIAGKIDANTDFII